MKKLLLINLIVLSLFAADDKNDLMRACIEGNIKQMQALLDAGADVNKANGQGRTPLYEASVEGEKEVAEMLISAGADVDKADIYGWTPLHQASDRGHEEIVEMLLISGADKTKANNKGETAIAIANRNREYVIAKLLANSPRVLSLQQLALKIVRENQVPHDGVPDDAFENLVNETYNRAEKVMESSA